MPKQRGIYLNLPQLLTRQTIDHIMLGYVIGYRHTSKVGDVLQVRAAVDKFREDFGINEDEYSFDSMIRNFYKIYGNLSETDGEINGARLWKKLQSNGKQISESVQRD